MTCSTVSTNTANGEGGGVFTRGNESVLVSSTVSNNTGGTAGGVYKQDGSLTLRNSIFANSNGGSGQDIFGSVNSQGFSLIENTGGQTINETFNAGTNITGADPKVSTTGANYGGVQSKLGAPGPENTDSPIDRTAQFPVYSLDSTVGSSASPNRERDLTSDAANNSTYGTMTIRHRFTNNTGGAVTRLRYPVVIITGEPVMDATMADLRVRTSADTTANVNDPATCAATGTTAPCAVTVRGTALEAPSPSNNGGLNSSLSLASVTTAPETFVGDEVVSTGGLASDSGDEVTAALGAPAASDTIGLAAPLANGASVNVQFLFGIQKSGRFRFYVTVEALP